MLSLNECPLHETMVSSETPEREESICKSFKNLYVRYYSAKHKIDQWRIPGYAINFGVKQSTGQNIFISCAEIYHVDNSIIEMQNTLETNPNALVIPKEGKDDDGNILKKLKYSEDITVLDYMRAPKLDNIHLPFFMGMKKSNFIKIGGYDEDLTGIAYDDNDFVERMNKIGCFQVRTNCKIIHLYHPRLDFNNQEIKNKVDYNKHLYLTRRALVVRNKEIQWGKNF